MARKSRKAGSFEEFSPKTWRTAIYARLSREENEHDSIETQIEEVKDYVKRGLTFNLIDIYADNGYSGSNFARPEFERLMEDIRNRHIDCIVVKDLSRFAREHIGAEDYLNNIFPFLGIRFIAIRDGYDNINIEPQEYFIASFKNFANAHFAKETSLKVSKAKRELQENGKYIGSKPPFGYKRDPNDKHRLIIDEEKAVIVREIFARSANGESHAAICKDLVKRGVKTANGGVWDVGCLYCMLNKEAYIGVLIQHKTEKALYKGMETRKIPKDEQIRIENAFPAIIEREVWDKAHVNIKARSLRMKKVINNGNFFDEGSGNG
jgi:DNA invertase Pin-like site-specific DNA recombinase